MDGWQRVADLASRGELTQAIVLKTMNEILERTTGERLDMVSVQTFLHDWLKGKETTGKSDGTSKRYRSVLNGFIDSVGPKRAKLSISGIHAKDIERFRDSELSSGKSASSVNLAVRIVRAVLNDAVRKGLIASNPANSTELLDMTSHEKQPFTDEQISLLLSAADSEWKGMILLGAHAGLRIGDAAKMLWSSVNLDAGTLTFEAQKTKRRNSRKPRPIAMHTELREYFEGLPLHGEADTPVFKTLHARSAGGNQGLSNAFCALMEKAGIGRQTTAKARGKGRSFSGLSFHSLRHTFISRLANADVTADVRKEIAGHSSDEIHRRYTHLDLSAQRRALTRISGFSANSQATATQNPTPGIRTTKSRR